MIGYTGAVAAAPAEHPEILERIFDLSCIIPAAGLIVTAVVLLLLYPLNKKRVDENVATLSARHG